MLPERLRSIFRKENDAVSPVNGAPRSAAPDGASGHATAGPPGSRITRREAPQMRLSRGLEQFFFNIRDVVGLAVLDAAGANQENINYLINLGHKVYSQDLVRSIDEAFGADPAEQTNVSRIEFFLRQNFD